MVIVLYCCTGLSLRLMELDIFSLFSTRRFSVRTIFRKIRFLYRFPSVIHGCFIVGWQLSKWFAAYMPCTVFTLSVKSLSRECLQKDVYISNLASKSSSDSFPVKFWVYSFKFLKHVQFKAKKMLPFLPDEYLSCLCIMRIIHSKNCSCSGNKPVEIWRLLNVFQIALIS